VIALGIDIGGTRIKAGMVNGEGRLLFSESAATPPNAVEFREVVAEMAAALVKSAGQPAGAGIACKGVIEPETTRVAVLPGTLHFLEGFRLADLVELGVPVHADNDARVAMAGEMVWGAARGVRNALMLTLGTGVGGAAVVEGRLLRGAAGVGGHFGHVTVDPDGPLCICGNRGCLETVFSARAIEAEAIAGILRGCDSRLRLQYHDRIHQVTCRAVFELAAEGDALAAAIRNRALKFLAGALAGLMLAFDPEVVIAGGQIADAGAALFDPLREQVWARSRSLLSREVPVVPPQVEDKSGVIGAAALVVTRGGAAAANP
jgi:glucokinase